MGKAIIFVIIGIFIISFSSGQLDIFGRNPGDNRVINIAPVVSIFEGEANLTNASLDLTYLRLDTSNDPLQNGLDIDGSLNVMGDSLGLGSGTSANVDFSWFGSLGDASMQWTSGSNRWQIARDWFVAAGANVQVQSGIFIGNGSGLTSVCLTNGTGCQTDLWDNTNVAYLNNSQTFTGNITFEDDIIGNGSQLTDVCLSDDTGCSNYLKKINVTKTINTTKGHIVEIGNWTIQNGAHQIQIFTSISDPGLSQTKVYFAEVGFDIPSDWRELVAISSSGDYTGIDIQLDVRSVQNTMFLRLRNGNGGAFGGDIRVEMINLGLPADTFVEGFSDDVVTGTLDFHRVYIQRLNIAPNGVGDFGGLLGNYQTVFEEETVSALYETNTTMVGGSLAPPRTVASWIRQGVSAVAFSSIADWQLSRWEVASVRSRTRLTLRLMNSFATSPISDIITFRSDGRVGIGTTTPTQALDVVGNGVFSGTSLVIDGNEVCQSNGTNCPTTGNATIIGTQSQPSRSLNITYTNNNGAPLFVYGSIRNFWDDSDDVSYIELYSNNVLVQRVGRHNFGDIGTAVNRNESYPFNMIVLEGDIYSINTTTLGTSHIVLEFWNEAF